MGVFDQYLLSLQNTPSEELFTQFKQARVSPNPVPSHTQGTPVLSHQRFGSVESRPRYNFQQQTPEEAQQHAARQYANDADTAQLIKETTVMPFAETASALAGTAAGIGAVGGQLSAGVPLKDAILEYSPEFWRTNRDYKATVQGWLGDPSQLSEAISTHGVEPVIGYLAPLVGGPERASELLEGVFGIVNAGGLGAMTPRPSALVKNVTKGAAVAAVVPALEAMSTEDLNKLALGAGTLAIVGKYNKAGKLLPSKEIPNLQGTFSDVGSKSLMKAVPKGKVDLAPNWRQAATLPELLSDTGNLGLGQTERLRNANVRFDLGKDFEGMYDTSSNTYHFPKKASTNDVLKVLGHETFHSSAAKNNVLPGTMPKAIDLEKTHGSESLGWSAKKRADNQDYMYRNAEGERYAEASNYLDRLYEEGVITESEYLAELQRNPYQVTVPESGGGIYSDMPMSDQPMYPAEWMGYGKEQASIPSIKQQVFELQKTIRETQDPSQKAELGRRIKELQQSKPVSNIPVIIEKPIIDPEGPTFQLKSLNAINQLKPEMKLNGPQLYKHLKRNGVSDAEIDSVLGDIKTVGPITTATRWASQVEQSAPKIGVDIYGGKEPDTSVIRQELTDIIAANDNLGYDRASGARAELLTGHLDPDTVVWDTTEQAVRANEIIAQLRAPKTHKPAPYQTYFNTEAAKYGSDRGTYQVARVNAELPRATLTPVISATKIKDMTNPPIWANDYNPDQFIVSRDNEPLFLANEDVTTAEAAIRDYVPSNDDYYYDENTWKETEHGEITTQNPLGGFITSEAKLPSGEAITVMYEGQPPNIVKEQGRSVEQTAKKKAAEDKGVWDELSDQDKETYLRLARTQKAANPVPEPLAERAMELASKQMIAQAKEAGHAGILLSTGEDVIKRWSNALKDVADEARYNPETQELKLFKNGSPSRAQSQVPAKVPPEKLKDYVGGQEAAERLLASDVNSAVGDWEPHQFVDNAWVDSSGMSIVNESANVDVRESGYDSRTPFRVDSYNVDGDQVIIGRFSTLDKAKQHAESIEHVLTDLSIDKHWPTIEYGQFDGDTYNPGKIAKTIERLTGGKIEMVDVNPDKYVINVDRMDHRTGAPVSYYIENVATGGAEADTFTTVEAAQEWVDKRINKKPFLRFTEDTPKTFSIYEWAAMTGLSIKMIEEYLNADDNKKKRMVNAIPVLGMITAYHGSWNPKPFKKFNIKQHEFSGAGTMEHGYGTYLTKLKSDANEYSLIADDIGTVYSVKFDANPSELIIGKNPISKQSTKVKSALKDLGLYPSNDNIPAYKLWGDLVESSWNKKLKGIRSDKDLSSKLSNRGVKGVVGAGRPNDILSFDDSNLKIIKTEKSKTN